MPYLPCLSTPLIHPQVFKESTGPDIVPHLLAVVGTQLAAGSGADLAVAARVLKGLSKCAGFSMTLMLLSDADRANAAAALDALAAAPKHAADATDLRAAYRLA